MSVLAGKVTAMLTVREHTTLRLAATRFAYVGAKEERIRVELGESPTRYYARLNRLLDEPAAVAEYPVVVNRLRRVREVRRVARGGGRPARAAPAA